MIVRQMTMEDLPILKKIHDEQYPNQVMPNFEKNFWIQLVVTDDDGRIISGGGIQSMAKADLVTDKTISPHQRKSALLTLLKHFMDTLIQIEQEEIHAFVAFNGRDETYCRALQKVGFVENVDKLFVKGVDNG